MTYAKPNLRAIDLQTGAAFCNFWFRQCNGDQLAPLTTAGGGVCASVSPVNAEFDPNAVTVAPVTTNTIVGIHDGRIDVTPLAGTGLPLTQSPVVVGVPLGTRGIDVEVSLFRGSYAVDRNGFGASVAGQDVILGLP